MRLEDLPSFIECCEPMDCGHPHFLTFNRDIDGDWSAAYVEFENHNAICFVNHNSTLSEAAYRLHARLKRSNLL